MQLGVLRPFLYCDLAQWSGLPQLTLDDMVRTLGTPQAQTVEHLGYYPCERYCFPLATPTGGLIAYTRQGNVVLVETVALPAPAIPAGLPEPCGQLPHELLIEGAYAHEYVYCEKGLVLTIARSLKNVEPDRLVRYRGVRRLANVSEFGPEYYKAFEDRELF